MLEDLKRRVLAGKTPEYAWESFRTAAFPGMDDDEAKDALLGWGEEYGIETTVFSNEADVLCVMFSQK